MTIENGDIVKFEMVMNKQGKDSGHYIEIKRYGSYSKVNDVVIKTIDEENNLSAKVMPPRPERPESTHITYLTSFLLNAHFQFKKDMNLQETTSNLNK